MGIIAWIVLGAIAGWIASMIMHSDIGILGDIIIGIIGALLGGFLMALFGQGGVSGLNIYSILISILGAVILLWIIKSVRGRSSTV